MGSIFPLPIFPEGALTHSVVTTVWIGVLVVTFFNLRLGWPLTGIVIPGYLVPLAMAKPWAALTVLIEGIITYLLVRFFSSYLSRLGKWHNLFGRDRFFAIVLTSLAVRILLDGWILPELGRWLNGQLGIAFDFTGHLRSFGLIITALIANYFWKPGLRSGLFSLLTVTGLTFILIRFGLMELTNFNIGRIEYMYEDMVTFFLASPKAYIIIIVTSFLASRMNVKYGWEYSGIMIPSLLALQWYQPIKLAATLVETLVIVAAAIFTMSLPFFRSKTIEGARKLLLFFNIAFLYKFLLGHLLLIVAPHIQISDFYGFGYLLTTLIAIKMHDKSFLPQMTRSLFQTSLVAVLAASLLGFSLTFLSQLFTPVLPARSVTVRQVGVISGDLMNTLRSEKLNLYKNRDPETLRMASPPEIDIFGKGVHKVMEYISGKNPEILTDATALLAKINWQIDIVNQRFLLLREIPPYHGGGLYLFRLDSREPNGLLVEIPAPIDEWLVLESGTWLFLQLEAKAMAIAGTSRKLGWDYNADVTVNPQTFFHTFHRIAANNNVLQIRAHTPDSRRIIGAASGITGPIQSGEFLNSIWIKSAFPPGLSLSRLKALVGDYDVFWEAPPYPNVQRRQSREGFAELFLNRPASRRTMVNALAGFGKVNPQSHLQRIDGYLQDWLLGGKGEIAEKSSGLYIPMTMEELLFMDQEILSPLLNTTRNNYHSGTFTPGGLAELQAIDAAASILGYRLYWYRHQPSGHDYLILSEEKSLEKRSYNGTYVFRLGATGPHVVEIPRPLYERYSFEYGVYLFERLQASALLIAGAHPYANRNHSSDVIQFQNKNSLFNLVNQVLMREYQTTPLLVVSCRAFGYRAAEVDPGADAFLAFGDWLSTPELLTIPGQTLWNTLIEDGLNVRIVDGSAATRGYEMGLTAQYLYLSHTVNKEYVLLWLSPDLREYFRQQTENRLEEAQFTSLGLPTQQVDIQRYVIEKRSVIADISFPVQLKQQVETYLLHHDIVFLNGLVEKWKNFTFERLIDMDSRSSFLAISLKHGDLCALARLTPRTLKTIFLPQGKEKDVSDTIKEYYNRGFAFLVLGEEQNQ